MGFSTPGYLLNGACVEQMKIGQRATVTRTTLILINRVSQGPLIQKEQIGMLFPSPYIIPKG